MARVARVAAGGGVRLRPEERRNLPVLWIPAYVALGSNLRDPEQQVHTAFERLAGLPETQLIARSALYRTRPLGPQDQPDFVNAAAGLLTFRAARTLLQELKAIERDMGREEPARRWGPRVIDLDLLVYGSATSDGADAGPVLPHPAVHERNFVLYPLADIAPELHIPGRGTDAELARRAGADGLQRL